MVQNRSDRPYACALSLPLQLVHARAALLLAVVSLWLTACVSLPDVSTDCESYGVVENHQPLGKVVVTRPLYRDELDLHCGGENWASAKIRPDSFAVGCVVPHADGTVLAYYWAGDKCAMNHEVCHAIHGTEHTQRYVDDVRRGIPAPYCPPNPWGLTASAP